jgi:hypothetical protein
MSSLRRLLSFTLSALVIVFVLSVFLSSASAADVTASPVNATSIIASYDEPPKEEIQICFNSFDKLGNEHLECCNPYRKPSSIKERPKNEVCTKSIDKFRHKEEVLCCNPFRRNEFEAKTHPVDGGDDSVLQGGDGGDDSVQGGQEGQTAISASEVSTGTVPISVGATDSTSAASTDGQQPGEEKEKRKHHKRHHFWRNFRRATTV